MKQDLKTKSKYLSLLLRHNPDAGGITLDKNGGWAKVSDLMSNAGFSRNELELIVANDDKQRYSFDTHKRRIRANQGHSIADIEIDFENVVPPEFLYHGTVQRFIDAIMKDGLKKQTRYYLHLSKDVKTATEVGSRRGDAVILKIHALDAYNNGFQFLISKNGVYLIDFIPSNYITIEH